LLNLPESLLFDLTVVGGDKFMKKVGYLYEALEENILPSIYKGPNRDRIRKIVSFPDREDKMRVVAILDYFSQSVLKPLHSWLNGLLKTIKQDVTFNQGAFTDDKDFMSSSYFVSADLSAATDRFPISLISDILKARLPDQYVDS
jgi:hypothetical protein